MYTGVRGLPTKICLRAISMRAAGNGSSAVPEYVKCVADRASCHWHYSAMWYVEKRLSQQQIADPAGHARRFGGELSAVSAGLT
jgi:hypothetical protein